MQQEQFIKGMEILRPYISPTEIARSIGKTIMTIHNYMNGLCPDPTIRSQIYTNAKMQFDKSKDERKESTAQLHKIGI